MADLRLVIVVFGFLPLLALPAYWARPYRAQTWALLAGILAFLGLSHAMATVLPGQGSASILFGEAAAIGAAVGGLVLGVGIGWLLLVRRRPGPSWASEVALAATAFLAIHSLGDGLVLGEGLAAGPTAVPIAGLAVAATVVHRFVEGAIVVVPGAEAGWRPRWLSLAVLAGALTLPAAGLVWFADDRLLVGDTFAAVLAGSMVLAGVEAGLAFVLLVTAFLPRSVSTDRMDWVGWAALGFAGIVLVHALAE